MAPDSKVIATRAVSSRGPPHTALLVTDRTSTTSPQPGTNEPADHVEAVGAHPGEAPPAAHIRPRAPVGVVGGGPGPLHPHVPERPKRPAADEPLHGAVAPVPAQVVGDPDGHAGGLGGLQHAPSVSRGGHHRLLHEDVLARRDGRQRLVGVQGVPASRSARRRAPDRPAFHPGGRTPAPATSPDGVAQSRRPARGPRLSTLHRRSPEAEARAGANWVSEMRRGAQQRHAERLRLHAHVSGPPSSGSPRRGDPRGAARPRSAPGPPRASLRPAPPAPLPRRARP